MQVSSVASTPPRARAVHCSPVHQHKRLHVLCSLRNSASHGQLRAADEQHAYVSTAGVALSKPELSSLRSFCKQMGYNTDDISSPVVAQQAIAALANLGDTEQLEGAILLLEQLYLTQRSPDSQQDVLDYLRGKWQMTFATGGLPRRQVVPVPEYFYIVPDGQQVVVETLLGPLTPVFTGDWTWDHSQRLLQYSFRAGSISAWGRQLLRFPFALRDRKAQFFFIGENHACARSGAQGVILFARQPAAPAA